MNKQEQVQTINNILALIDSVRIFGADAVLVVRIKESLIALGNTIAQEANAKQEE